MQIQQISVFLENKPGAFCYLAGILSQNGINMRAMSVAETADFGILRIIVDDTEKTKAVLTENGCIFSVTPVIAVEVEDHPGSLMKILEVLRDAEITLDYMYAFITRRSDSAYLVFRVSDPAAAVSILEKAGINVADRKQLNLV